MLRRIKLAMLVNDLNMNGISNVVLSYCRELNKYEFEIHIIAGTPVNPVHRQDAIQNNIVITELPSRKKESRHYYKRLFEVLRDEKFDIVHVHGNSATMTVELFLAWLSGTTVRIAHSHNTTCSNMKVHKLLYPFFSLLYTDGFACSDAAGKWLFHNKPFTVIYNGFRTEKFVFNRDSRKGIREALHIKDSDFVMGHVGRFNSQKNHEFLLRVFESVATINLNAWLLLIGDGPDFEKVKQMVSLHPNKERIIVYGETKETAKMYSAMDVFVFPSKFEGLGIVALEAQISGLPCIVSDNVPKDVILSDNIQFVSLCDKKEWIESVLAQERFDQSSREEFYEANRNSIMKYDIDNDVKLLERQYLTCLNMIS